jgi:hypothetical protein
MSKQKKKPQRKPGGGRKREPIAAGLSPWRRRVAQWLRASINTADVGKVAKACKVAASTVYYWMQHGNTPFELIPKIARTIGTEPPRLLP